MSREILNKIIRNRKTIYPKQFSGEELSKDLINEILENAIHAPTHRMTQPWFFKVYKGESKGELSSLIKKIDQEKISKIKIDKFIEKINLSDTIISICMNRDKDNRVPEWEEIAAISMAVQNMWLSCYVNNVGSYWSSSPLKDEYSKLKKLDIDQRCLGFFFMGSYDHKESPKSRDNLDNKVEWGISKKTPFSKTPYFYLGFFYF
tara:strand:+ start:1076 stop:1690 length:615 start_codon:yes stop_codon:yes gene_type:complete